jgi:squalene-hopene/tetraprenyl-beta-curcumene cyclase
MIKPARFIALALAAAGLASGAHYVRAAGAPTAAPTLSAPTQAAVDSAQAVLNKSFDYLKKQEKPDFSWQAPVDPPGMSALILKGFVEDAQFDPDMAFLDKGFDKLLSYQLDNGGIYKDALANYNTAIAVSALAVSKEAEYVPAINKALKYLHSLQWSDTIDGVLHVAPDDPRFGGTGYGKGDRPDLSNLSITLDALHDANVPPSDPAFAAAIKFVTRCQNLSETNDQKWAGDDGGFVYTPAATGVSPAGEYTDANGRRMLRSYGSMTYAGLKSMIYAGLTHDDPRVKAAFAWISKNFTVDHNPGLEVGDPNDPNSSKGGLYYYYETMARALNAYGQPVIVDAAGTRHDWRLELINAIKAQQAADGSFLGQKKWMEDNPILATGYVVLALEDVKKDLIAHPVGAAPAAK